MSSEIPGIHIRLPEPKELDEMLEGTSKRSEIAERKLKKALDTAWASMSNVQKDTLLGALHLTKKDVGDLLARAPGWNDFARKRVTDVINEMRVLKGFKPAIYPAASLPSSLEPTRSQRKILRELFNAVAREMRRIGNGLEASYLFAVFGAQAGHAKDVFIESADALDYLLGKKDGIAIDALRKQEVWCCGGLTSQENMALPISIFDDPSPNNKSGHAFLTIVHESTHAAKPDKTSDALYEHHQGFKFADEQTKVTTADYYKVTVRQIATDSMELFIPTSVAPPTSGRSVQLTNAATQADKILNAAWISAIRIHDVLRNLSRHPNDDWGDWARNASRLMGLTLHRPLWVTTSKHGTQTVSFVDSQKTSTKCSGAAKTKTEEKIAPLTITTLDLSIADNKIAMLGALNGKGKFILVEPPFGATIDERIDHVINQVLQGSYLPLQARFSKSLFKDVIVIRSLANLHESIAGQNMTVETLRKGIPEPMKTYGKTYSMYSGYLPHTSRLEIPMGSPHFSSND